VLQAIPADRQDIHRVVLDALRARYDGQQVKFDAAIVLASGRR
jgi:hypothetical protein